MPADNNLSSAQSSVRGTTVNELTQLGGADITPEDFLMIWNNEDSTTRKAELSDVFDQNKEFTQGYYALLTNFYFNPGNATETEIAVADIDTWQDVNFTTDVSGLFDYRPTTMKDALADPYDDSTQYFSLEGLSLESSVIFRASMTFEPDEDEGQLDARLNFQRHTGTDPSTDFQIEDVALSMSQGADLEYPAEPSLTFFVGDTIDTNGAGDAGKCKFQIKASVPGTVRMRALTWYISQ